MLARRDEDQVRALGRLFECFKQRVLPGVIEQFGLIDDEDLAVIHRRREGGRAKEVIADHAHGDGGELSAALLGIIGEQGEFLGDDVQVGVGGSERGGWVVVFFGFVERIEELTGGAVAAGRGVAVQIGHRIVTK